VTFPTPKTVSGRSIVIAGLTALSPMLPSHVFAFDPVPVQQHVELLEDSDNVRIGVAILDTATGQRFGYRAGERFPLNSTFKAFACGALLAKADNGELELSKRVPVLESEIVPWSPVTEKHIGEPGLSYGEHCRAVLEWSDNTSANVVLDALGGPSALTGILRAQGDTATRIDRY